MAKNYNYVILCYDVGEKRVNKVFKICKKYLNHFQNSVFRGKISPSNIIKLRKEINSIIDKDYDFISIMKMINDKAFEEEILGIQEKDGEDLFI